MQRDYILLGMGRNLTRKVFLNEVLYIKAYGSYSIVKMENEEIVVLKLLKEIHEMIPFDNFARSNRSFIINIDKCIEFKVGKNANLKLNNGEIVNVSPKNIEEISNKFHN